MDAACSGRAPAQQQACSGRALARQQHSNSTATPQQQHGNSTAQQQQHSTAQHSTAQHSTAQPRKRPNPEPPWQSLPAAVLVGLQKLEAAVLLGLHAGPEAGGCGSGASPFVLHGIAGVDSLRAASQRLCLGLFYLKPNRNHLSLSPLYGSLRALVSATSLRAVFFFRSSQGPCRRWSTRSR